MCANANAIAQTHTNTSTNTNTSLTSRLNATEQEFVPLSIGDCTLRPPTSAQMHIHQDKHNYPSTYDIFI